MRALNGMPIRESAGDSHARGQGTTRAAVLGNWKKRVRPVQARGREVNERNKHERVEKVEKEYYKIKSRPG